MMNDSNGSKKISWVQIVNAVVQALIVSGHFRYVKP